MPLALVQDFTGDHPVGIASHEQALALARGCGDVPYLNAA